MQTLNTGAQAERFWTSRTLKYAASGLIVYLLSQWLLRIDSTLLLVVVSIVRLGLVPLILGERPPWLTFIAAPYPFTLAFSAYAQRSSWLPEAVAMEISGPAAFLMCVAGAMLLSIPVTGVIIDKASRRPVEHWLRPLAIVVFGITALAVLMPAPQLSVLVLKYAAEPIALAGYATVLGFGTAKDTVSVAPTPRDPASEEPMP